MKVGGGIMVLAMNAAAQPIGFPVPLDGFADAFAGKPIDNAEYKKARGQLMAQIRQRQQEAYEKMKAEQMKDLPPKPGETAASPCGQEVSYFSSTNTKPPGCDPGGFFVLRVVVLKTEAGQFGCMNTACRRPSSSSMKKSLSCGWRSGRPLSSASRFCSET